MKRRSGASAVTAVPSRASGTVPLLAEVLEANGIAKNYSNLDQPGSKNENLKQPASDLGKGILPSAEDFRQILTVDEKGEL